MKIFKIANQLPPITGVAIKDKNGKVWFLPKPNRHGHVIHLIRENGQVPDPMGQGFIAGGEFVDRLTAWHHAHANKQILPPYNPVKPEERRWDLKPTDVPGELFSEDLW